MKIRAPLGALLATTACFALAPSALAGGPFHAREKALDVSGLNKACGAAVDSKGDLYVASAGQGKIKVFAPANHKTPIGEIANSNEPCGLAVNTKGDLFVSERATGNVVRYEPTAYPFTGPPSYGAREVIDASGEAKGISVDPFDDRLYVAEGERVSVYGSKGELGNNEVQEILPKGAIGGTFRLALPGEGGAGLNETQLVAIPSPFPSGGTFTLSFKGQTTAPIAYNRDTNTPDGTEVRAALESLSTIGTGNVSVIGYTKRGWWVEFTGVLAKTDVPLISGNPGGLEGGSGAIAVKALSDITSPIPYEASTAKVAAALEALEAIGSGNVSVESSASRYLVSFVGELARTGVEALTGDSSGLTDSEGLDPKFPPEATTSTVTDSWSGHIGEGELSEATGVAPYTYVTGGSNNTHYLLVADAATDQAHLYSGPSVDALKHRRTVEGPKEGESFEFGAAGTAVAADPETGHFLLYDDGHKALEELEATGELLDSTTHPGFADAGPSAIAVDPQRDEVQEVTVKASGGSFKLKFKEQETAAIPYNAATGTVQNALQALAAIGKGGVIVGGGPQGTLLAPYAITFSGAALAKQDVPALVAISSLSGTGASVTVSTVKEGKGGALYAGAGAGAAAKLLAFKSLSAPKREPLTELSSKLTVAKARAVATDRYGDVYVSAESKIYVFDPAGTKLVEIADAAKAYDVDVDSEGNLYVLDGAKPSLNEQLTYYKPSSFPPSESTTYTRHEPALLEGTIVQLAVNPISDRVFIGGAGSSDPELFKRIQECSSAKEGFSCHLFTPLFSAHNATTGLAAYGATGAVWAGNYGGNAGNGMFDASGGEVLTANLDGAGCPSGGWDGNHQIGIDQTNGHLLEFVPSLSGVAAAREYEASGTCVAEFGVFSPGGETGFAIAADSACAIHRNGSGELEPLDETTTPTCKAFDPSNGNVYVASDGSNNTTQPYDVNAFGPLDYGTPPPLAKYKLTLEKKGSGSGKVTSDPPGIDCGSACAAEFEEETRVTLSAKAAAGSEFKAWSGCDAEPEPEPGEVRCEVALGEARKASAEFESTETEEFELAAAKEGPGAGTVTSSPAGIDCGSECSHDFLKNTEVTLSAKAGASSEFAGWGEGDCETETASPAEGTCTVTMTEAREVRAAFEAEHPVLSVEVKGPGTVTSSPAGIACPATCTAKFALHAKVTLTAKAGEAAEFKAWSGCDSKPSPSQCTVSMDEPRQVSATFTALPQAIAKPAQPVLYKEATLRGEVGTAGVKTEYRFEYLSEEAYAENGETFAGAQQTPTGVLAPSEGLVAVKAPLVGLKAGTVYRFRLQVENAIGAAADEAAFTTLQRQGAGACPNIEYRTGASAGLPDCRAYEMVTPADTGGHPIHVPGANFPEWPVAPRGEGAGNRVSFGGLFPGFEGNGNADTFVSRRGPGPHPAAGWVPELIGPDYEQVGGEKFANPDRGVSADQEYSLYQLGAAEGKKPFPNTPAEGSYLRVPGAANAACNSPATEIVQPHFELVGCGSLGGKTVVDPAAVPRFPSAGARHLIFTSDVRLDDAAPAAGTEAIYDREAGAASAEVLSTQPEGGPFAANVSYIAASEDGDAVVFAAAGALYLHRAGQTTEISAGPATFAGVSADGSRVFYADAASGGALPPAGLFACDTEAGSCIAGAQPGLTQIAADSTFVALAAGGANAYFTSEDALTGPEENEAGQSAEAGAYNLYAWDGAGTRLIAVLDPEDTAGFDFPPEEAGRQRLDSWVAAVNQGRPASVPARSTPGGEAFVFGSRARLSAYDTQGVGQVYRYAPAAAAGERLLCVSCAQTGTPPGPKEALLASLTAFPSVIGDSTLTYNVTDDGGRVFFQSPDRLVPEDANGAIDVYEWVARGEGECTRPGGCLALISSGQGEASSFLYGMTPDGHDVLFRTPEKLIGADIAGNPSLYDARIDGGIPEPPLVPVCHGDACQGEGSEPPPLTEPATGAPVGNGNVEEAPHRPARCPKGKRRVKGRCVKPHKHRLHKHRKHKRAMTDRRTER
jgi:DNA-binding beta-propeller fold protein YncE